MMETLCPFIHSEVEQNLRIEINESNSDQFEKSDVQYLMKWLMESPKITSYRVNTLTSDSDQIKNLIDSVLEKQRNELNISEAPKVTAPLKEIVLVGPWKNYQFSSDLTKEVIVSSPCGVAVLRGSNVFAPGVMAISPDVKLGNKVKIFADVAGKCRKGLKTKFTDDSKIFLGEGIVKMTRKQLFKESHKPSGVAVDVLMPVSMVPAIGNEIGEGSCLLQNIPSIVCCKVLDPQPGEIILDMCAAPGNKTTHIAEIMENKGLVIALDKVRSKIPSIEKNCKIHCISIVRAFQCDSTRCAQTEHNVINSPVEKGPPFAKETFDRILLDAPCTALGQRPLLRNTATLRMLQSFAPLQRNLFYVAVDLLKPGGRLVYSTCTIRQEENEFLVAWALKTFSCLKLKVAHPLLGGPGWPHSRLSDEERLMVQRFGPEEDPLRQAEDIYRDTIGFFIACFEKVEVC